MEQQMHLPTKKRYPQIPAPTLKLSTCAIIFPCPVEQTKWEKNVEASQKVEHSCCQALTDRA
jgi:hypothetical protein